MLNKEEAIELIERLRPCLPIDRFSLDKECADQAVLYDEVSSVGAEARSAARKSKEALELIKARLGLNIRGNPEAFNLSKISENAISSTILIQDEYQKALQAYLDIEEISSALDAFLKSIETRKSMLREEVNLFVFRYYAEENKKPVSCQQLTDSAEKAITDLRKNDIHNAEKDKED